MLIYVSENKINNIFEEIGYNKKISFSPFSETKINLNLIEAQLNAPKDSTEYKLRKIIRYLKHHKKLKTIDNKSLHFLEGYFYKCHGTMFLHKAKETQTGVLIDFNSYTKPNSTLDFDVNIGNDRFPMLVLTYSLYNLRFLDFTAPEIHPPNSTGSHLISVKKEIPVDVIFVLLYIDSENKILYGSPLLITC